MLSLFSVLEQIEPLIPHALTLNSSTAFSLAALSWKWLATPAGCCSCGCDTESTEMERGQRLPPLLSIFPAHKRRGGVAAHMYTWTHSHTHSWGWFDAGVKVKEHMGRHVVTFLWTTGASLALCLLPRRYLWLDFSQLQVSAVYWVYLFNWAGQTLLQVKGGT